MPPKVPDQLRIEVRLRADFLCEYCHTDERFQLVQFTIDHIVPLSQGGKAESANLAPACFHCNRRKSDLQIIFDQATGRSIPLFNPRTMTWSEHFHWSEGGTEIIATSEIGRITIDHLRMNRERIRLVRLADVLVNRHPPQEDPRERS